MIVCPGGGYARHAKHEGEQVAQALARAGIAAWVLHYRTKPWLYPAALADAQRSIRILRHRAQELGIDAHRLGIMGFSAGGHVAGSLALRWDSPTYEARDEADAIDARPDWSVLSYAVVSAVAYHHQSSWLNALGPTDWTQRGLFSLERYARPDAPPCFLWSTSDDQAVRLPIASPRHRPF